MNSYFCKPCNKNHHYSSDLGKRHNTPAPCICGSTNGLHNYACLHQPRLVVD